MNHRILSQSRLLWAIALCVVFSALLWLLMLLRAFQTLPPSVRLAVVCVQQVAAWLAVVVLLWWFVWGAGSKARSL